MMYGLSSGALTQLVECHLCKVEVRGSSPLCSTAQSPSQNTFDWGIYPFRVGLEWTGTAQRGLPYSTLTARNILLDGSGRHGLQNAKCGTRSADHFHFGPSDKVKVVKAGASDALLYRYFAGKEDLYAAIVRLAIDSLLDRQAAALDAPNDSMPSPKRRSSGCANHDPDRCRTAVSRLS